MQGARVKLGDVFAGEEGDGGEGRGDGWEEDGRAFASVQGVWDDRVTLFTRPQFSFTCPPFLMPLTGDGDVEAGPVKEVQASGLKRELEAAEAAGSVEAGKRARGEA